MGNAVTNRVKTASVKSCALHLFEYCQKNNWAGFDPYDALNSRLLSQTPFLKSRVFRIAITQLLKRLPLNLRPCLLIPQEQNPKALGIFLMALLKLKRVGLLEQDDLIKPMVARITALRSPGTPFWCWGYSFPWQTRTILVPRWAPNIVCTSFVANALLDTYEEFREPEYLGMAVSAGDYILSTLYWTGSDGVASFSYPLPGLKSQVHNANFLAAALLCRIYKHCGEAKFLEAALRSTRYSASQQRKDGSWAYGEQSTQGWVDNFHTGYNLCALRTIGECAETREFESHLAKGFVFYRSRFFTKDGAPKYFHDRTYPIDIHSIAQSIITLVSLKDLERGNLQWAHAVWKWAFSHMWDKDGYFYYRVLRFWTVRISYMRWSQAWMLLALATLLEQDDQIPLDSVGIA